MIEYLDNFNKNLTDLQNLDVDIIDEDKILILLNSLPETYDHLTTMLLYKKDEVKFIDVLNTLMNNEYQKKDQKDSRDSIREALTIVQGRKDNRKPNKSNGRGRSRSKSKENLSQRRPIKDELPIAARKDTEREIV